MNPPEELPLHGRTRRILANGVALLLAYVLPRVFTLASVVVAARWLGTDLFGAYGAAAAFAVIVSVVATLGMLPLLVREIAREPERAAVLLGAAHRVKLVSGLAMVLGASWGASHLFQDPQVRSAVFVLSLGWTMNAFAENLAAYYQAVERMARWTQASALFGFVSALVGVPVLLITDDMVAYCWGFVAGWGVAFAWLRAGLPPNVRRDVRPRAADVGHLLGGVVPFAIAFVGIAVYSKMDLLLLERWRGPGEAGIYAAAYKFVDVFQALLIVAAGAVYPHLSRLSERGVHGARARSMEVVLLASAPVGLFLHLVAEPLVTLLFGVEYAASTAVLSRLGLLFPLLGVTILGGYVLGASGRMGPVAVLYALGVVANYQLNRWLIPSAGAIGAATARLGSEALLVSGFLLALSGIASAAPKARALGIAAACVAVAAGVAILPDPTRGWLRGGVFLVAVAVVYIRGRALSSAELGALRTAMKGGVPVPAHSGESP